MNKLYAVIVLLLAALSASGSCIAASSLGSPKVYEIDVHGAVWPGQEQFVVNCLNEAAAQGASAVILDVDSFGGLLQSADAMKDAILKHDRDYVTVGYVHNRALSSGSLITLSCKYIAMGPAAALGSAQPHPDASGGVPDPELLSYARKEFQSTAEARARNANIALAWVTSPAPIPSLGVKAGDILTLTTKQAQSAGYCDVVANSDQDILAFLKMPSATIVYKHLDFWQSAALFVCQPWVTALLLGLGIAAVIIELFTLHSWGIAGVTGAVVVGAVFAAHIITGTATIVGLLVFLAGIGLLLFETHVLPGHGLSALAGLVCIFLGIYWAIGGTQTGSLYPAATALFITFGSLIAFFMYLPKSRIWRVIGQNMQQRPALGYVASADYTSAIGELGVAVSPLRPAGIAEIDGARMNVVTEGAFLQPGTRVEVVKVQGSRIVVRQVAETVIGGPFSSSETNR